MVDELLGRHIEDVHEAAAELVERLGMIAAHQPVLGVIAAEQPCQRPHPIVPVRFQELLGPLPQALVLGASRVEVGAAAL